MGPRPRLIQPLRASGQEAEAEGDLYEEKGISLRHPRADVLFILFFFLGHSACSTDAVAGSSSSPALGLPSGPGRHHGAAPDLAPRAPACPPPPGPPSKVLGRERDHYFTHRAPRQVSPSRRESATPKTTRTGDLLTTYPGVARRNNHQTSGAARSGDSAAYLLPHAGTADSQRDPGYKRVLTNSGVSARATPRRLPQSERERDTRTHTHGESENEDGRQETSTRHHHPSQDRLRAYAVGRSPAARPPTRRQIEKLP